MIESDEYVTDTPPPWAEALFEALNRCTPKQANARRIVLPYQVQIMERLPDRAILLNRWYKPLGMPNNHSWTIPYEDHPEAHIHIELFKLAQPLLNDEGYFFDEECVPWLSTTALSAYRTKIKDLVYPWIRPSEWEA